jgi:hypothetical protein
MSCGDNPIFKINGRSSTRLTAALKLACDDRTAIGYALDTKDDNPRMVFFWASHAKMIPFPGKATPEFLASFIEMWLNDQMLKYPSEPDHDGDNAKGWFIYTEGWGHIEPYHYPAFLAIEPHWIMYGK